MSGVRSLAIALVLAGGVAACADGGQDEIARDRRAEAEAVILVLAPVLNVGAPPCDAGMTPAAGRNACYRLASADAGEAGVATAVARQDPGEWVVDVRRTQASAGVLDAVARPCFDRAPACPTGQLAVVNGGEVVSVAPVNTDRYTDELQITAGLSEREARTVASVLTS